MRRYDLFVCGVLFVVRRDTEREQIIMRAHQITNKTHENKGSWYKWASEAKPP